MPIRVIISMRMKDNEAIVRKSGILVTIVKWRKQTIIVGSAVVDDGFVISSSEHSRQRMHSELFLCTSNMSFSKQQINSVECRQTGMLHARENKQSMGKDQRWASQEAIKNRCFSLNFAKLALL